MLSEGSSAVKKFKNGTKLEWDWTNNTPRNIYNLTISITVFKSNLEEDSSLKIDDQYLNPICYGMIFNYGMMVQENLQYFRIRFKGRYCSAIPLITLKMVQEFWYSFKPSFDENGRLAYYDLHTTYNNEIKQIKTTQKRLIIEHDNFIDKKYQL